MKRKGQISVEFIILLAIFMLFFQSTILPSVEFSENIIKDTHSLVKSSESISRLINTIENYSNTIGYGKRKMFFYLPPTTTLLSCGSEIEYKVIISKQKPIPSVCDADGVCVFLKEIKTKLPITCDTIGPGFSGYLFFEKTEDGSIIISK